MQFHFIFRWDIGGQPGCDPERVLKVQGSRFSRCGKLCGVLENLLLRADLTGKTLLAELPGYVDYTQHTHYRLLPGVWQGVTA